jgi:predicted dinucleotide-binding enzyme
MEEKIIMSGTINFDISGIETNIGDFPDGPVEAEIVKAEIEISKATNAMIVVHFKVFHPDIGHALVRDYLVPSDKTFAKKKIATFYGAYQGLTLEEVRQSESIDINPIELKGAQMIVVLGTNDKGYKQLVPPFYYDARQTDVLPYMQEAAL